MSVLLYTKRRLRRPTFITGDRPFSTFISTERWLFHYFWGTGLFDFSNFREQMENDEKRQILEIILVNVLKDSLFFI